GASSRAVPGTSSAGCRGYKGNSPGVRPLTLLSHQFTMVLRSPLQTLHMINVGVQSLPPYPRRMSIGSCPGFPGPAASSGLRRSRMDDVVNRMAKELSDAIAAAVAEDTRVEAVRERARAAGFEMKISLEAVIGL